ncbi:MAG: hypothetical protein R3344_05860 [Acidobacteriota bacterium]|nr:hypothetical protein [Acidobacteriota bacterium]
MSSGTSRREFLRGGFGAVVSWALLDTLVTRDLFADEVRPVTDRWARELITRCADLRSNTMTPVEWQAEVEQLLDRVDLEDLLRYIDFERLTASFDFPELGASTEWVAFPRLEGLPEPAQLYKKIFGLKRGRAIIPHGHQNMVSAHLVLRGEFHLRHYDRIEDDGGHLVIRPTMDRTARAGESSSISDDHNNVHWFVTTSDYAYTFDVILTGLDAARANAYEIDNLDIEQAEALPDGLLRVPKLGVQEALEKYGSETHHDETG